MTEHKIYLDDPKPEVPPENAKSLWWRFILVFLALGVFFISPLPAYILSLIPKSIMRQAIAPIAQNILLDESNQTLDTPKKFAHDTSLPVLGRETGLCFIFTATRQTPDPRIIKTKRLKNAAHGKPVAEIIAMSLDNKEYTLSLVTLDEEKNKGRSVICQKFGKQDSLLPDAVKAVYVRPLAPFTPEKIYWASRKDLD